MLEVLGEGGMATVWKARQVTLDRLVAIKLLSAQLLNDEDARQRFQKEARAAAQLKHPGIVQVFDAGELNGQAYFIMEYIEGISIADLLDQNNGHLPINNAFAITEGVAEALAHAWEDANMIHCDIKPDNILMQQDGRIKVADLGLATILDETTNEGEEDTIFVTPNYASPEQSMGESPLDFRSDIYSLGTMLYQMITGQLPFQDQEPEEVLLSQIESQLPDPLHFNAELLPGLPWLIEKMLIKDRHARHRSWRDFLYDLKAVRAGKFPAAPLPELGASTLERHPSRLMPPTAGAKLSANKTAPASMQDQQRADHLKTASQKALNQRLSGYSKDSTGITGAGALGQLIILGSAAALLYGVAFLLLGSPQAEEPTQVETTIRPPSDSMLPPRSVRMSKKELAERNRGVTPIEKSKLKEPAPTPSANSNQPVESESLNRLKTWQDPDFIEATRKLSQARKKYKAFLTDQDGVVLDEIEKDARKAIALFEKCREDAPEGADISRFITAAYKIISDVHQSTILTDEE